MTNLVRRGKAYFARLHVPRNRQADVGKAFRVPKGVKRDHTKTLKTDDRAVAQERLPAALEAIRAEIDAKLRAAGLRPLTDWRAPWDQRAVVLRDKLNAASTKPYYIEEGPDGSKHPWTPRGDMLEEINEEAREIEAKHGPEIADRFHRIASNSSLSIAAARDAWLRWLERADRVKAATMAGHKASLGLLGEYLKERHGYPSLDVAPLDAVSRAVAGRFIDWRLDTVSPKTGCKINPQTVQRELSSMSGLWGGRRARNTRMQTPGRAS